MPQSKQLTDNIHWIGLNDRTTHLFESVWPLPHGISYNSYIIDDDKVAVIDSLKPISPDEYLAHIRNVIGEERQVDYLIVNHMEPDHSGAIKLLREAFPGLQVVGNKRTTRFLENFYGITEGILTMEEGGQLPLGRHTLQFSMIPMVHWPETMVTYETTEKILFSGDAFGAFGALDGGIFDDQVDKDFFYDEIIRYFSNIVGKYCTNVLKAIEKLQGLELNMVASTHGPVWRQNPWEIIKIYEKLSNQEGESGVVVVFGSMYGNTQKMAEAVVRGLHENGCKEVVVHDVSRVHPSYILRDLWRYSGVVIGGPAYDKGLFPLLENLAYLLEEKKLSNRSAGIFGSCGWSGGGVKRLQTLAETNDWHLLEPVVEATCSPDDEDLKQCYNLGASMAESLA